MNNKKAGKDAYSLRDMLLMMKGMLAVVAAVLLMTVKCAFGESPDIASNDKGIWSIAGTEKEDRWIIIHNLAEAKVTGIFHIEVIQRGTGAPAWQIVRLVKHMAITEDALRRSIIKPLSKGAVYPESYDYALAEWKAENEGRGGYVCSSSVLECLPK